MRIALIAVLSAGFLGVLPPARAGQSCEATELTVERLERGLALAERTRAALDASGDRVVVLARAGRDLRKYGLRHSHVGFAYREKDGAGGHRWRVLHKLNHCGSARGAIFRQGLGEFFLDDLWRYEAAWVRPSPELQSRLADLLARIDRSLALNEPRYNLVAYPWSQRYQQSNQWAIETLAAALRPEISTRAQAQQWLRADGYAPTVLRLGTLERLGGRMTAANVAFDDHPNEKRFSGRIETVGADSVFDWLRRTGRATETVQLVER